MTKIRNPRNQCWKNKRVRLWKKQKMLCHWCGTGMKMPIDGNHEADTATMDHVIPKRQGGTNQFGNLVLACFSCNSARNHEDNLARPVSESKDQS